MFITDKSHIDPRRTDQWFFFSFSDPTPEVEARRTLLAVAKAKSEQFPLEGKRLVSEREWHLLQEEVSVIGTRTVCLEDIGEDVA